MRRPPITRAQRGAIYRLFARYYSGLVQDLAHQPLRAPTPLAQLPRWPALAPRLFPNRAWRTLYRSYRRRFQIAGIGSDLYLFGQPFDQGEHQIWVGIETDGYVHS